MFDVTLLRATNGRGARLFRRGHHPRPAQGHGLQESRPLLRRPHRQWPAAAPCLGYCVYWATCVVSYQTMKSCKCWNSMLCHERAPCPVMRAVQEPCRPCPCWPCWPCRRYRHQYHMLYVIYAAAAFNDSLVMWSTTCRCFVPCPRAGS